MESRVEDVEHLKASKLLRRLIIAKDWFYQSKPMLLLEENALNLMIVNKRKVFLVRKMNKITENIQIIYARNILHNFLRCFTKILTKL